MIYNEKLYAAVWGFIIGDAMGVPYEFLDRNQMLANPATGISGWGSHFQPPGTWSDDTSMMLCVLENQIKGGTTANLSKLFIDWYRDGYQTADGKIFDIGKTTMNALNRIIEGVDPRKAGSTDEFSAGNGSLMRCLPYAFADNFSKAVFQMVENNKITHRTRISHECCFYYVRMIRALAEGMTKKDAMNTAKAFLKYGWRISEEFDEDCLQPYFLRLFKADFKDLSVDLIKSSGYVIETLESAVWCFMNSKSYEEAVLKAVNLGGDTDTIAALTGALGAVFYGIEQIPEKWKSEIVRRDYLEKYLTKLIKSSCRINYPFVIRLQTKVVYL